MNSAEKPASLSPEILPEGGCFIVIEGSDACGKSTQFEILRDRFLDYGLPLETFSFPKYKTPSAYFVQHYLDGEYGPKDAISAQTASLFYALDRYDARADILAAQNANKLILSSRFVASNAAHQGCKIENDAERATFIDWLDEMEFKILGIPRPDLYIILDVPYEVSQRLMLERAQSGDKKLDVHELDPEHQKRSRFVYNWLCQQWPDFYKLVDCSTADKKSLLDRQTIADRIWQIVLKHLQNPQA